MDTIYKSESAIRGHVRATTHWDRPGHLIVSESCRFGMTDAVNGYIVSTVGDYIDPYGKRATVGCDRFYETRVFKDSGRRCEGAGCRCGGLPEPASWSELDMDGYQTAEEAKEGHAKMVYKYQRATTIEGRPAVSPTEIRASQRRPTARDITEHLASIAEQYELGAGWGDMTLRAFCEAVEAKRGGK